MTTLKLSKKTIIEKVPTNIITGFLGSGKSTLIQSLLANKQNNEHWVILINEFGEVGLDEQIIESNLAKKNGKGGQIQISQIAGGCLCCANGVPFQVALVQLLKQQDKSPDRLIIEPTGLGHPKQLINQLSAQPFINLQTVFTVVDPKKVQDARYSEHELFTTQVSVADVVVCNKQDGFNNNDFSVFQTWMKKKDIQPKLITRTEQGVVDENLLDKYSPSLSLKKPTLNLLLNTQPQNPNSIEFMEYQEEGSTVTPEPIKVFEQNVEGFYALGLIFDNSFVFDEDEIVNELMDIDVIRIKSLIKTPKTALVINSVDSVMTQTNSDNVITQSRFQFISHEPINPDRIQSLILSAKI